MAPLETVVHFPKLDLLSRGVDTVPVRPEVQGLLDAPNLLRQKTLPTGNQLNEPTLLLIILVYLMIMVTSTISGRLDSAQWSDDLVLNGGTSQNGRTV